MTEMPRAAQESKTSPRWRKKENFRRIAVWAIGVVVLAGLLVWLIVVLVQLPGHDLLTIYGNVDIRSVDLGFREPGRIAAVLKDEGDRVKKGDLLAQLDPATYQDALAERSADLEIKQAVLKNAELGYQRNNNLIAYGGTSKEEYDNASSTRDQAQANLDLSKAQMASAQTDLDDTRILAPSDGVVITRAQEPGAIVQAGSAVLTISLDRPIWVRAYIAESDLGRVHPGKEVEVFTDTQPDHPYHGKIGYVSPEAEFTPKSVETTQLRTALVYRLRVVIDDADDRLRQGMPVTVKIPFQ